MELDEFFQSIHFAVLRPTLGIKIQFGLDLYARQFNAHKVDKSAQGAEKQNHRNPKEAFLSFDTIYDHPDLEGNADNEE
jgi:hypothetical protein